MYNPAVARFNSIDRFAEKYQSNTSYHYTFNNPILFIDVNGDSAWSVHKKWDQAELEKFQAYSVKRLESYERDFSKRCTCEDLALNLLIDYASENGLPVNISNGAHPDGLSSNSEDFTDVESFRNEVLKTTGASDVVNNSTEVGSGLDGLSESSPGNLISLDTNGDGTSNNHIQIVKSVDNEKQEVIVSQGNQNPGSSNPNNLFYGGTIVTQAIWFLDKNTYKGQGDSNTAEETYKPSVRIWDIKKLNKE